MIFFFASRFRFVWAEAMLCVVFAIAIDNPAWLERHQHVCVCVDCRNSANILRAYWADVREPEIESIFIDGWIGILMFEYAKALRIIQT